jgi:multiple sugar transport system permease protein
VRRNGTAWALLAPTLVVLAATGLLPFLYVLYVGFFDWNPLSSATGEMMFSGVGNYRRLVFDQAFLGSLWRTVRFTLWAVGSELVLGYLLAQLLTRDFRGKSLFRLIHTLPLVVAPIAIGAIWRLLLIPGFGPIPHYLQQWFGIDYNIGDSASHAFWTTVLMDVWHWTPLVTLTLLAGLTGLPQEPFEQAAVDGANRWQTFRYLTLPLIMPVVLTTVFLRVMDSLRIVDEVFMLTGGGPGEATRYIGIHIFRIVFPKTDYGYGSSMSLLVLYLTIVLSWLLYAAMTARRSTRRTA